AKILKHLAFAGPRDRLTNAVLLQAPQRVGSCEPFQGTVQGPLVLETLTVQVRQDASSLKTRKPIRYGEEVIEIEPRKAADGKGAKPAMHAGEPFRRNERGVARLDMGRRS